MAGTHLITILLFGGMCIATGSGHKSTKAGLQHLEFQGHNAAPGPDSANVLPTGPSSEDVHQVALAHATVIPDPPRANLLEGPMPAMKFACGSATGYFMEPTFSCKAFHYCDGKGSRYTFLCDEGTTFNQILGQCEPGLSAECGEATNEPHPELSSESRRRGQPEHPHHSPGAEESADLLAAPADGDILVGAANRKRLQHATEDIPEPRVVHISSQVPVAESIRSTTGRPLQLTQGDALQHDGEFFDTTGHSAPFFNGAANSAPSGGNTAPSGPFVNQQFQQQGGVRGNFAVQGPGFPGTAAGFDGRTAGIGATGPGFGNQGLNFGGQNPGFAPGFNGVNPAFGGQPVGFDGRTAGFTGRSSDFVQQDPRLGFNPALVGRDPRFITPRGFSSPPPDFSSGVPFAFREFGGVPTNQGSLPAFSTDAGNLAGSVGANAQGNAGKIETTTPATVANHEPSLEASQKVGHLSGNGGQVTVERGIGPTSFAPVVAEDNFQSAPGLGNQQGLFQQNGFQAANNGFSGGSQVTQPGVNNFLPVSQRQNPFLPTGNSQGFAQNNNRFIQGNLEILFPQQFRADPNGFHPSNPGVFQAGQDRFLTDLDQFSPVSEELIPGRQGFIPRQAGFPQGQGRFVSGGNNFQAANGAVSERADGFSQHQRPFAQDHEGFSPEQNFQTEEERFFPEQRNQLAFDEQGGRPGFSIRGRNTNNHNDESLSGPGSAQNAEPNSLDNPRRGQNSQPGREIRINRGKFPLPRDQFLKAKQESRLTDQRVSEEQKNENGESLEDFLQEGRNGVDAAHDELHSEPTVLRPTRVGSGPSSGFDRTVFAIDRDGFEVRPRGEEFSRNSNRFPPEHRSSSRRFSPGFQPNQDRFTPIPGRFSGDRGRFSQDRRFQQGQGGFPEDERRFPQDQGRFSQDQGRFSQDQGRFSQDQGRFSQDQGRFPTGQGNFVPNENRFGLNQGGFSPNSNRFAPNQNQFATNQHQFEPDQTGFAPEQSGFPTGQDRFTQVPVEQNRIQGGQDRFTPNQDRFTPNPNQFNGNQNDIQQQQQPHSFFTPDNSAQGTPQFPVQPSFQPNQGRFGQNLNTFDQNQNRFQQDQGGFTGNPNQFQQTGFGFKQNDNSLTQDFDSDRGFGGAHLPQDPNFPSQDGFIRIRHPNQFDQRRGPTSSQFPSQLSNSGIDAFAPPQRGNIRGNHIAEDHDFTEVTTAPPPRIVAPLPKNMIDHMDKSDAEAARERVTPTASSIEPTPTVPGRGPVRRRKPPRHRPPPRGHVSAMPDGAVLKTTLQESAEHENLPSDPSNASRDQTRPNQRPGQIAVRRQPPAGTRSRFGRRRTTTAAPEVTSENAEIIEPSDTTGPSGDAGNSVTTDATETSAGRRRRLGIRRRLPGGFRSRGRTRLRRPSLTDNSTDTSGQEEDEEQQSDALADSTLERPQYLDHDTTSPSGDGLLREPSTLDATTIKPNSVRRRRPSSVAARRRRLRGRQQATSSPSLTSSAETSDQINGRRYREGDGAGGRRESSEVEHDNASDNTWLDSHEAPSGTQQLRPQPGSRRPPHTRFRPGRRRINDFQVEDKQHTNTGFNDHDQDFQRQGIQGSTGFDNFHEGAHDGLSSNGATGFQDFASGDSGHRGFGQDRFSHPTLAQTGFANQAGTGFSDSLAQPGRRQQFQPFAQQDNSFNVPERFRGVFARPRFFHSSPSALASTAQPEPVTAPSQTDRFHSRPTHRSSQSPTDPTSALPIEEVVTGRSIGRGPVTIVSTGTSTESTSPAFEDTTTAVNAVKFAWSEPAVDTTTRRSRRPSLPEVADLPPDLVDRRHPHSRSSTSLSGMLNGRQHVAADKETNKHHRTDLRRRIQQARTTEATQTTSAPAPPPTAAVPVTKSTAASTSAAPRDKNVAKGDGDWRTQPWTTSFEKAAAKGSVSDEDIWLDSITEMVVATTTPRPLPAIRRDDDEEPRLPLQALFDNL